MSALLACGYNQNNKIAIWFSSGCPPATSEAGARWPRRRLCLRFDTAELSIKLTQPRRDYYNVINLNANGQKWNSN
jgi:hypothetical protein